MRELILEQKTGFETSMPFEIFDLNGFLFYDDKFNDKIANGERLRFNLPSGKYNFNGSFIRLDKPVEFEKITLPPKERHIQKPKKGYQVIYGNNPNKCTIYYKAGIIIFDNSFRETPIFYRYGIYFHEIGHHFYKTEWKADMYATKKMIDFGFNPSQIALTGLLTLSSDSYDRKERMTNLAINIKQIRL